MNVKAPIFLAMAAALGLSACDNAYAIDQNGNPQNARNGAITGALIGGVLGATADGDERLTKAAAGAIAGAAVGGIAGSFLDRQARELQSSIGGNGTTVTNNGNNLTVNMAQDVLFATDSTSVSSSATNNLYELASSLNRYPNSRIDVVGHTDSTGSDAYNMDLSQRRAAAVASVLRNGGVSSSRLSYYGRGETQPVASNATDSGRAQNRRVEIVITPTGN